jgi:hypothetical protein
VVAHPQHTETSGFDANGASMLKESYDQVLVFAKVKLHNQSKQPIFLYEITANATLDNVVHSSNARTNTEYERIFSAHPDLAPLHGSALSPETTIDPGQTVEGTFVSQFRLTKQQWDACKDLNFSFGFQYLPNLVLAPRGAVIDQ